MASAPFTTRDVVGGVLSYAVIVLMVYTAAFGVPESMNFRLTDFGDFGDSERHSDQDGWVDEEYHPCTNCRISTSFYEVGCCLVCESMFEEMTHP
jgi:hypothetical protein